MSAPRGAVLAHPVRTGFNSDLFEHWPRVYRFKSGHSVAKRFIQILMLSSENILKIMSNHLQRVGKDIPRTNKKRLRCFAAASLRLSEKFSRRETKSQND